MKTYRKKMLLSLVLGLLFSSALWAQVFNEDKTKQNYEDQTKKEWIDKNPEEYINQGGQMDLVPEFNSKTEKEEWFKANKPSAASGNGEEALVEPKRTETKDAVYIFPYDESFPVYVKTGDKMLDDQNYAQKKQDWINNNQAKYATMSNPSPNKVMTEDEKKERRTVNQSPIKK
jgi:hypothetical protein